MLAIAEITVRLFVPRSLWEYRPVGADWQPHPVLGWVQKPDLDVLAQRDDGLRIRFQTNQDGLTPVTARQTRRGGVLRIMFVGDSTVVGRNVPQAETIHAHLERGLHERGIQAEVINAGVEGYSTDQTLLRLEELLPLYQPDVVLYGLCDNDFGGNKVNRAYGLHKPLFSILADGSLQQTAPRTNSDTAFLGTGFRAWMQHIALYRVLRPKINLVRAKWGRWEERNLLGAGPAWCYRPQQLDRIDWQLFISLVQRMEKSCAAAGARFVIYAHPSIAEVWDPFIAQLEQAQHLGPGEYNRYALEERVRAETADLDFCPIVQYFVDRQERGPFHLLPRDPHCNGRGYQLIAEVLAAHLQDRGYLAPYQSP
jgi:lysophospholipase L1-like esterase